MEKIFLLLILFLAIFLRLYQLDKLPLYTDEIDQGYNAYSILKTGRDEHGAFLPVSLRSFGDWKPPVQTYIMLPFVRFLGLNEYSLRLPQVFLGLGTLVLTYFLIQQLYGRGKSSVKTALISFFLLAVSPWHLLQSRSAMLVMVSLFFMESGVLFFLKSLKKPKLVIISAISFILSIYSYYGMRIISPIMIVYLAVYYRKNIKFISPPVLISVILGAVLLLPLGLNFIKDKDVILGRARTVSVFYDQGVKLRQWELISQDGIKFNTLISRFFHNNVYMYSRKISQGFLSHFHLKYLLQTGDQAQPFHIPGAGIILIMDSIMMIYGIYTLFRYRFEGRNLLIIWLIVSIIPASLTFMVPASNRTFSAIIPLLIFASIGLVGMENKSVKGKIIITSIAIIYTINIGYFFRHYFHNLPLNHANIWNFGVKETVLRVSQLEDKYENVVFSDINGMPYVYLLFYKKIDPVYYQQNAVRTYVADRFGYEHIESLGKYLFDSQLDWNYLKDNLQKGFLYVIPADQKPGKPYVDVITYPNGSPAYYLIDNEKI